MNFNVTGRAALLLTTALATSVVLAAPARAQILQGGNDILVTSTTYQDTGAVSTALVPGQQIPTLSVTGLAVSGGSGVNGNPLGVFFNSTPDANFGVTSPLTITQYTPSGSPNFVLNLPAASATNAPDGIVTSFSSKSEGALTISPNGQSVTLMATRLPWARWTSRTRKRRARPSRAIRISRRPPIAWRRRSARRRR